MIAVWEFTHSAFDIAFYARIYMFKSLDHKKVLFIKITSNTLEND